MTTAGSPAASASPESRWPRASGVERGLYAVLAVVLAAAIGLGMALAPAPGGMGTHTRLGLPPCGMLVITGRPCPTCGVTTSFALASHGRLGEALVNQPFGLVVFLLVVVGLALSAALAATGRSARELVTARRTVVAVVVLTVLALASWGYKLAAVSEAATGGR